MRTRPELLFMDGPEVKSISINQLPPEAWTNLGGAVHIQPEQTRDYWQAVPWLRRAVQLRADAVAGLPFALVKENGDDLDTAEDWQNEVGFLPRPRELLWLIEAALTLLGRAYLLREEPLRYIQPTSIEPQYSREKGLIGFKRRLGNEVEDYTPEQMVYFWQQDPFEEIGPGTPAAQAALMAAGVLSNVDKFAANFFERGAIKATLLTLAAGTAPQERDRVKTWWRKVFSGVDRAWGTEIVSDKIEPVVIGEGIQELSNVELTREKREDIGTALGIPHTLLFADAANYATAEQDDKHFYSKTIVPEAEFIAEVFTTQVFEPMGLRMVFRPETLDVFQTDENERAQAFAHYVAAGLDPWIAGPMLGLELPEGYDWEQIKQEKEQRRADMAEAMANRPPPGDDEEEDEQQRPPGPVEQQKDLSKWRRAALKRYRERKDAAYEFQSDVLADDVRAVILERLEAAEDEEEVKAAFAAPFCGHRWEGYP